MAHNVNLGQLALNPVSTLSNTAVETLTGVPIASQPSTSQQTSSSQSTQGSSQSSQGTSSSSSNPTEIPGVISRDQGVNAINSATGRANSSLPPNVQDAINKMLFGSGTINDMLIEALKSNTSGINPLEQELINKVQGTRQAQFSALGIGDSPAAQSAIAAAAAPVLLDSRNKNIANLISGANTEVASRTNDITAALGAFEGWLKNKGLDMDTFLQIAKLAIPQVGQVSNATAQNTSSGQSTGQSTSIGQGTSLGNTPGLQEMISLNIGL